MWYTHIINITKENELKILKWITDISGCDGTNIVNILLYTMDMMLT